MARLKLGLDLDQSLNRASETFKASSTDIDSLSTELQQLGLDGQTTGNTLYLAWALLHKGLKG